VTTAIYMKHQWRCSKRPMLDNLKGTDMADKTIVDADYASLTREEKEVEIKKQNIAHKSRLELAVEQYVDNMSLSEMTEYIQHSVLDHYTNECNDDEVESFIVSMYDY